MHEAVKIAVMMMHRIIRQAFSALVAFILLMINPRVIPVWSFPHKLVVSSGLFPYRSHGMCMDSIEVSVTEVATLPGGYTHQHN